MFPRNDGTTNREDHVGLDDRTRRISDSILDGIEQTLAELTRPRDEAAAQRTAIETALWSRAAPRVCRHVTCRRAQRCRSRPCVVPRVASASEQA